MNQNDNIWSIPYIDMPVEFWQKLSSMFGDSINEVYFPLQLENLSTGRPEQPKTYLNEFIPNSPFYLSALINPIVLGKPAEELASQVIEMIKELVEKSKIQSVTITSTRLAEIIKKEIPGLKLNASVLTDIYHSNQLAMISDIFDVIVVSSRITRDIKALEKLRKSFRGKIRLIVNEGCLPNCVFRTQHFYEMGAKLENPRSLCSDILKKKEWLRLTGSWILPQHLYLYDGMYDELKLSGRVTLQDPEYYLEVLDAYIHRKMRFPNAIGAGPAGVTRRISIEESFFITTLFCDKSCDSCTICEEYWNKHVKD